MYLVSTFISGEDKGRLMVTNDLQTFHPVGVNVNSPQSGGVRDWTILPVGNEYFAFSTAGAIGGVNYFAVDHSTDLITWARVSEISTAELGAVTHTWSPFIYTENEVRHVFISVSTDNLATLHLYRASFVDDSFLAVTPWVPVVIANISATRIIGLNLVDMGGLLTLWFKDEATQKICTAWGGSADGEFIFGREVFPAGFEGAGLVNTGGANWSVLIDKYRNRGIYRADSTDHGNTWSTPQIVDAGFDQISNAFIVKADTPKMLSDIVSAMAILSPRAVAFGGHDKPEKQIAPNHSGFWAGGKVGFLHLNTYGGYEACSILVNCAFDGANYYCIDTSKPAWLLLTGYGDLQDSFEVRRAPATTGACLFAPLMVITADGDARFAGNLGIGNSATATTLGTVTRKMEVFDSAGASLGFVPLYDGIT